MNKKYNEFDFYEDGKCSVPKHGLRAGKYIEYAALQAERERSKILVEALEIYSKMLVVVNPWTRSTVSNRHTQQTTNVGELARQALEKYKAGGE
jgi:hypothetical protein